MIFSSVVTLYGDMKVAIIPTINLPMPPVKGGAVQNLINELLLYNEDTHLHDFTVYSIYDEEALMLAKNYSYSSFEFIALSPLAKKIHSLDVPHFSGRAFKFNERVYIEKILRKIKRENFDIILLENTPDYAPLVRREVKGCSQIVLHLHNDWVNSSGSRSERIVGSLEKIICVSDYIKGRVESVEHAHNVSTIHNAIKLKYNPEKDSTECNAIREKYGVGQDDVVIVFSGRLVKDKGAHILIEALVALPRELKFKVFILGSRVYGETIVDPYLESLLEMVKSNHLNNIYFPGYIPYDKIKYFYYLSDIGVLPSLWDDPQPLTILEYMTFGLPIVTTKSGGIPEMVDSKCAYLLDRDDELVDNCRNALYELITNKNKRNEMAKASFERSKLFSMDKYLSSMMDLFK